MNVFHNITCKDWILSEIHVILMNHFSISIHRNVILNAKSQCYNQNITTNFTKILFRTGYFSKFTTFIISFQYFNPSKCNCECQDSSARSQCYNQDPNVPGGPKTWDENTCQCKCAIDFKECSTGFVYDNREQCR